jgi:hypothetical protein
VCPTCGLYVRRASRSNTCLKAAREAVEIFRSGLKKSSISTGPDDRADPRIRPCLPCANVRKSDLLSANSRPSVQEVHGTHSGPNPTARAETRTSTRPGRFKGRPQMQRASLAAGACRQTVFSGSLTAGASGSDVRPRLRAAYGRHRHPPDRFRYQGRGEGADGWRPFLPAAGDCASP